MTDEAGAKKRPRIRRIEFNEPPPEKPQGSKHLLRGDKVFGLSLSRRDAVLSVLTELVTAPPSAAVALGDAWDSRYNIRVIVSEKDKPHLFGYAILNSGPRQLKSQAHPEGQAEFRVLWKVFGEYPKVLFERLPKDKQGVGVNQFLDGDIFPNDMAQKAISMMENEARKGKLPAPKYVAWVWSEVFGIKPPPNVERPSKYACTRSRNSAEPERARERLDEVDRRRVNMSPNRKARPRLDGYRGDRRENSLGLQGSVHDYRYSHAYDRCVDKHESRNGSCLADADVRTRQDKGGWVRRSRSQERGARVRNGGSGSVSGGFLRRAQTSEERGGQPHGAPRDRGKQDMKSMKLTDLTFEQYLKVCGEIEEEFHRVLWQQRMRQPNALSEWRALCLQHNVRY